MQSTIKPAFIPNIAKQFVSTARSLTSELTSLQQNAGATPTDTVTLSDEVQSGAASTPFGGLGQPVQVTIAEGDNLSSLLTEMGYSSKELYGESGVLSQVMKANPGLKNPNLIYPGQDLVLPTRKTQEQDGAASVSQDTPADETHLSNLNATELQSLALNASEMGDQHLNEMVDVISYLNPEDNKAVRQSMFYQSASDSGLFTISKPGEEVRNMSPVELRAYASEMKPEERAAFEEKVGHWASENPILSKTSWAMGAADWAQSNYSQDAPLGEQEIKLFIAQSANGVLDANQLATDSAYELFGRDPEHGKAVFSQIN